MLHRLTAFLLALSAFLAPVVAAQSAYEASERSQPTRGCCGDHCACMRDCPCVDKGSPAAPADEAPAAPAPGRDARLLFAHLPSLVGTLLAQPQPAGVIPAARSRAVAQTGSGRDLLARVSRWTT